MHAERGCLAQLMDVYRDLGGNLVALEEVPHEHIHRYGIVGTGKDLGSCFEITEMVEKPKPEEAPSNMSILGRYILQPEIFDCLAAQDPGSGGEIQLTDAMIALMSDQPFHGVSFDGKSYDCGDKIGFLSANVAYALDRDDIGPGFETALHQILEGRQ